MEPADRPHRSTSELFICFTSTTTTTSSSRLSSSSSMKLSSKSLLSPGRTRDQPTSQISLSSSLSRRLRTSGSLKGQASPMFPAGNKKRGSGYENPEPSSPKVTCIGQVRVKTKKQGKKMRMISSRSRRRSGGVSGGAEASFRKAEQQSHISTSTHDNSSFQGLHHFQSGSSSQRECLRQHRNSNNQRWVHLPLTICEALRSFGSEFNCLVPNRSSCLGEAKKDEESKRSESGNSGCGTVFARWFVALGDEGNGNNKRREIELVVGGEGEEEEERDEICSSDGHSLRRQVFEGIEFKEEMLIKEDGRVSVCVPPKNALLLMRCRSDPVKMAALGNRFWDVPKEEESDGEGDEKDVAIAQWDREVVKGRIGIDSELVVEEHGMCEKWVCEDEAAEVEVEEKSDLVLEESKVEEDQYFCDVQEEVEECVEVEEELNVGEPEPAMVEDDVLDCSLAEMFADPEEYEDAHEEQKEEEMREVEVSESDEQVLDRREEVEEEDEAEESKEAQESEVEVTQDRPEPEYPNAQSDPQPKRSSQKPGLPDCLLLMMCEPKLSMEVSKETWVCSTDFIRCLPERHVSKSNKKDGQDEAPKKPPRVSFDSKAASKLAPAAQLQQRREQQQQQVMFQPPRSSCSFPMQAGPMSMAEIIGQKLVGSAAYEPFVLTRCKSEPMRSAAKLAAPEACFWKNRKMEPHHRPGPLGVGATGVGC